MMTDSLIADRPFLSYLMTLNEEIINQLFEHRHCVIGTYRLLPPLAQQCLLKMMFRKNRDWRSWVNKQYQLAVYNSLVILSKLRILEGDLNADFQINLDFRMNYISSLLTSTFELSELRTHPLDEKSQKAANKDLLGKSIERWESILCYLALPSETSDKSVSDTTRALFQYIGLVKGSLKEPEISSLGFQFLLLNRTEQIWTYLIYYLRFLAAKSEDIIPIIEFFFRLNLCIQPYDSQVRPIALESNWPENIQAFILTLREIGLIFIRKRKDGWFLLTPLMRQIAQEGNVGNEYENSMDTTTSTTTASNKASKSGFLIVETNYRVYAYTNSTLQLAILSTFAEILYRFHDIAIGLLSRDSVRRALQTGITARQICQYLRSNAHPQMSQNSSSSQSKQSALIPITVIDQIYLWEQERKRFTCTDGSCYSSFDSEADFVAFRDFVVENKYALWHCNHSKMVIVDSEWDERVKSWWNEKEKAR